MHIHAQKLFYRLNDFMVHGCNSPTEMLPQLLSQKCKNAWNLTLHKKDFVGFTTVWNGSYWNLQSKSRRNRKSEDRAELSEPRVANSTMKLPLDRLLLNITEHPKKCGVVASAQPCLVRVPEWPDGKVAVLSCESLGRLPCLMLCCVALNCNPGLVVWGVHLFVDYVFLLT